MQKVSNLILVFLLFLTFVYMDSKNTDLEKLNKQYLTTIDQNRKVYNHNLSIKEKRIDILLKENSSLKEFLTEKEIEEEEEILRISDAEMEVLAKCVQSEAGNPFDYSLGQQYVVEVILNRVDDPRFPDTITEVIYQKEGRTPQFSVAYNGAMNKCKPFKETIDNINDAIKNRGKLPSYVLYFHSERGHKISKKNIYDIVDGNVFYFRAKDKESFKGDLA